MAASVEEDEVRQRFLKAAEFVRGIADKFDSKTLLYLYARFKQANEGPCDTERPGFFDFQGKQKWDAWNGLGDMCKVDAMEEYISEVTDADPDWEEKAGIEKPKSGMGVAVSTMANDDVHIPDDEKSIFDWCKDDDIDRVKSLIKKSDVNAKDMEGMSLLHWACDRGFEDMVELLLRSSADVNIRDAEDQTPLHYATSCEYPSIVRLLISHGADISLKDNCGGTAADQTNKAEILQLLDQAT